MSASFSAILSHPWLCVRSDGTVRDVSGKQLTAKPWAVFIFDLPLNQVRCSVLLPIASHQPACFAGVVEEGSSDRHRPGRPRLARAQGAVAREPADPGSGRRLRLLRHLVMMMPFPVHCFAFPRASVRCACASAFLQSLLAVSFLLPSRSSNCPWCQLKEIRSLSNGLQLSLDVHSVHSMLDHTLRWMAGAMRCGQAGNEVCARPRNQHENMLSLMSYSLETT
jgi:hypothetical protein